MTVRYLDPVCEKGYSPSTKEFLDFIVKEGIKIMTAESIFHPPNALLKLA